MDEFLRDVARAVGMIGTVNQAAGVGIFLILLSMGVLIYGLILITDYVRRRLPAPAQYAKQFQIDVGQGMYLVGYLNTVLTSANYVLKDISGTEKAIVKFPTFNDCEIELANRRYSVLGIGKAELLDLETKTILATRTSEKELRSEAAHYDFIGISPIEVVVAPESGLFPSECHLMVEGKLAGRIFNPSRWTSNVGIFWLRTEIPLHFAAFIFSREIRRFVASHSSST